MSYKPLPHLFVVIIWVLLTACTDNSERSTNAPGGDSSRLAEIQRKGQIIVGTAITRPFGYRDDETNELIGFDVDLMTNIANTLGVTIIWREMAFADLLPELHDKTPLIWR